MFFNSIVANSISCYQQNESDFSTPCSEEKIKRLPMEQHLHQAYDYESCCAMGKILTNDFLPIVLKVMKYSMQPAVFNETLQDFLRVFGNLDFLGRNNITKGYPYPSKDHRANDIKKDLMETNKNSRVIMCQYGRIPKVMNPKNCDLFHVTLTNEGFGYSFNQADFWDIFSSTPYTKEYAKIYQPKGFTHSHMKNHPWINSKNNILYPFQTGLENGLTVRFNRIISSCT